MDREYLEDYEQKEDAEYEKVLRRIGEGKFSFEKDKYPSDNRFVNLQKPVTITEYEGVNIDNLWAQIPFCGSLVVCLIPVLESDFEQIYFRKSEIQKVIDFVKETGKLQFVLSRKPTEYEKLDFLEPFFKQLRPAVLQPVPITVFGSEKDIQRMTSSYDTIGKIAFFDYAEKICNRRLISLVLSKCFSVYATLYLGRYSLLQDLENLMVDNPKGAMEMFITCRKFIHEPTCNMLFDLLNYTLDAIHKAQDIPLVYQPKELRFPCEIGKFLLEKLTYAPIGPRACIDLIDHYSSYDLQKVQTSLNEAIVTNHPDIVNKSSEELSEILDNVWNDKTIPRKVKGVQIGVPLSMAAIGSVAAGPIGAAGGFLAGLGFDVASELIDLGTEGLSERLAKLKTKSYQANIYDFKKKYKGKITE